MNASTNHRHAPSNPPPHPAESDLKATESVDLEDAQAVARAIALHQAGIAVFAVPFGTIGHGTLTWLDPRTRGASSN
jgi:hypothetical protein